MALGGGWSRVLNRAPSLLRPSGPARLRLEQHWPELRQRETPQPARHPRRLLAHGGEQLHRLQSEAGEEASLGSRRRGTAEPPWCGLLRHPPPLVRVVALAG